MYGTIVSKDLQHVNEGCVQELRRLNAFLSVTVVLHTTIARIVGEAVGTRYSHHHSE